MIPDIVVSSAIFFGVGLGIGVVTQYFHDCNYMKQVQKLYDRMVEERDKKLEVQKNTIDRLIEINNKIQSSKCHEVQAIRYVRSNDNEQR